MDKREREGGRREGGRRKAGRKDRHGRTTNQSFGNNLHRAKLTAQRNARCNLTTQKNRKTRQYKPTTPKASCGATAGNKAALFEGA